MIKDSRKAIVSWALYDWANSAFATTVMAAFFSIFFSSYWSLDQDSSVTTFWLGVANSVESLIVAILAPMLGAIADSGSYRKKFLVFFAFLGALLTGCLGMIHAGAWVAAMFVYIIANIGFAGANIFYDALLPTVASEKWMCDAEIGIREESCGCDDTPLALGTSPLAVILHTPYQPQYLLAFVEPDPEPVKTREESLSAYVNFKVDKHDILTDYKNNASELASIVESIERVDDDSDLTITSITIDGWASPEAPEAYNLALSERRAAALADYMAANTDVDRAKITATGRGEDWTNFRKRVVEMTKLLDQDKVLAIIDDETMSPDEKDDALKRLIPPTIYQRLMNEIYPSLRRNDYRIIYNVRNFDVAEARALLDSDPKKLSLSEMYRVAGFYEKGSAEYNHVLEVAARTYPTQVAAAVNAAARLIETGDYDGALSLLEKAPNDARVLNARGLAYARGGDADSARRTWSEAAKLGSAEAKHNIAELEKSLE